MDEEVTPEKDLEIKREDLIAEIAYIEPHLAARVLILFANWEVAEAYRTSRELSEGVRTMVRKAKKGKGKK